MQFQNPTFLYGLFALLIPLIIHLFNFRRYKKIYFSNIQFLKNIQLETRKQSRLKQLIVLMLRMLAVVMIVFAFADPIISDEKEASILNKKHAVSIFVDNSFSMEAQGAKGILFEQAKKIAYDILNAYDVDDKFQLLTMDFEGRHQKWLNKEEFVSMLQQLSLSPSTRKLSQVIERQCDLFEYSADYHNQIFLISDFQKNISDLSVIQDDSLVDINLVPLVRPEPNNLFIDSCWFDRPMYVAGQQMILNVSLRNTGNRKLEHVPIKLYLNQKQRALASFDIEANGNIIVPMHLSLREANWYSGSIQFEDYPITYDDEFYISFALRDETRILSINPGQTNRYLKGLFESDSAFYLEEKHVKTLNYSELQEYELIILDGLSDYSSGLIRELDSFVNEGGSLVFLPPNDIHTGNPADVLKQISAIDIKAIDSASSSIADMNAEHPLYRGAYSKIPKDVQYPAIFRHCELEYQKKESVEVILRLLNNDPFLLKQDIGKGKIYVFAAPMLASWTNFMMHKIFVPTFVNIAMQSGFGMKLYFEIGRQELLPINGRIPDDHTLRLKHKSGEMELIPAVSKIKGKTILELGNEISSAGNYELFHEKKLAELAYNFNRQESDLAVSNISELQQILKGSQGNVNLIDSAQEDWQLQVVKDVNNKGFWALCIWLVLLFLIAETVILRFWK